MSDVADTAAALRRKRASMDELPLAQRGRRFWFWLGIGQVVLACAALGIGLWKDSLLLPGLAIPVGTWCWLSFAKAARDRQRAARRFGIGVLAAMGVTAIAMFLAVVLIPDRRTEALLAVSIGGFVMLIAPLGIAWASTLKRSAKEQAHIRKQTRLTRGEATVPGLKLSQQEGNESEELRLVIDVSDACYLNRPAILEVYRKADVHESRPINDAKILLTREVRLDHEQTSIPLPTAAIDGFTYTGKKVSVTTYAELRLDDGSIWETAVRTQLRLPESRTAQATPDATSVTDPKDFVCLAANLAAIPLQRKLAVAGLLIVAAVVITANVAVGLHDQAAEVGKNIIYPQTDAEGESRSPLLDSLILSGGAGAAVWFAIRRQLRSYMTFRLLQPPSLISRDTVVAMNALVHGRSRVDIEKTTVRVIAYNLEKGKYTTRNGDNDSVVTFSEPVRAVVLYEQLLPLVPRGKPIEDFLPGSVSFAPVFDLLLPPNPVSPSHGLFLQWEVQLLHDKLVDHELIPSSCEFCLSDFPSDLFDEVETARA